MSDWNIILLFHNVHVQGCTATVHYLHLGLDKVHQKTISRRQSLEYSQTDQQFSSMFTSEQLVLSIVLFFFHISYEHDDVLVCCAFDSLEIFPK